MSLKIPLPNPDDLPEEIRKIVSSSPLNVVKMMANAPASFLGFQELAAGVLFKSQFDPRKREIAVCRIGHVTRANYEWTHHVRVARRLAITEEEIGIIGSENPVTSLDEEGNLLCRVADKISLKVRLSDEALAQILERYGVRGATELILCCSYFNMVSRFLESTRVELESTPGNQG
ncbi:MAG: carboxymuconolactone decarboxylase family protein [Deltaproteobacteria bacterium]|nr:carboxymuconolactone decarboxylase family protein [Deltaproteobacteria bacterium]